MLAAQGAAWRLLSARQPDLVVGDPVLAIGSPLGAWQQTGNAVRSGEIGVAQSHELGRAFANPVKPATLRWKS